MQDQIDGLHEEKSRLRAKVSGGERAAREVKTLREQIARLQDAQSAVEQECNKKERLREDATKTSSETLRQTRRKLKESQQRHAEMK